MTSHHLLPPKMKEILEKYEGNEYDTKFLNLLTTVSLPPSTIQKSGNYKNNYVIAMILQGMITDKLDDMIKTETANLGGTADVGAGAGAGPEGAAAAAAAADDAPVEIKSNAKSNVLNKLNERLDHFKKVDFREGFFTSGKALGEGFITKEKGESPLFYLQDLFATKISSAELRNIFESSLVGKPESQCKRVFKDRIKKTGKSARDQWADNVWADGVGLSAGYFPGGPPCYLCGTKMANNSKRSGRKWCNLTAKVCGVTSCKDCKGGKKHQGKPDFPPMECEHLLPVMTAVAHWSLIPDGKRDPSLTPDDINMMKMEYDFSHSCCNQIKSDINLIYFDRKSVFKKSGPYKLDDENILKLLNAIAGSDSYDCPKAMNKDSTTACPERVPDRMTKEVARETYAYNNSGFSLDDTPGGRLAWVKERRIEIGKRIVPIIKIINANAKTFPDIETYILFCKCKIIFAICDKDFEKLVRGEKEILTSKQKKALKQKAKEHRDELNKLEKVNKEKASKANRTNRVLAREKARLVIKPEPEETIEAIEPATEGGPAPSADSGATSADSGAPAATFTLEQLHITEEIDQELGQVQQDEVLVAAEADPKLEEFGDHGILLQSTWSPEKAREIIKNENESIVLNQEDEEFISELEKPIDDKALFAGADVGYTIKAFENAFRDQMEEYNRMDIASAGDGRANWEGILETVEGIAVTEPAQAADVGAAAGAIQPITGNTQTDSGRWFNWLSPQQSPPSFGVGGERKTRRKRKKHIRNTKRKSLRKNNKSPKKFRKSTRKEKHIRNKKKKSSRKNK